MSYLNFQQKIFSSRISNKNLNTLYIIHYYSLLGLQRTGKEIWTPKHLKYQITSNAAITYTNLIQGKVQASYVVAKIIFFCLWK